MYVMRLLERVKKFYKGVLVKSLEIQTQQSIVSDIKVFTSVDLGYQL